MRPDDQVYRWMTPCPQTIARSATMASARALMRKYDIRHLPVLDSGEIVGIVSERDLSSPNASSIPTSSPSAT
jgi:CBS domain-containing protein